MRYPAESDSAKEKRLPLALSTAWPLKGCAVVKRLISLCTRVRMTVNVVGPTPVPLRATVVGDSPATTIASEPFCSPTVAAVGLNVTVAATMPPGPRDAVDGATANGLVVVNVTLTGVAPVLVMVTVLARDASAVTGPKSREPG